MRQHEDPVLLTLDEHAANLIDGAAADYEKRMRDGEQLAGIREWACKAVGAAVRIAGLLHLAEHLRDGWGKPINRRTASIHVPTAAKRCQRALPRSETSAVSTAAAGWLAAGPFSTITEILLTRSYGFFDTWTRRPGRSTMR